MPHHPRLPLPTRGAYKPDLRRLNIRLPPAKKKAPVIAAVVAPVVQAAQAAQLPVIPVARKSPAWKTYGVIKKRTPAQAGAARLKRAAVAAAAAQAPVVAMVQVAAKPAARRVKPSVKRAAAKAGAARLKRAAAAAAQAPVIAVAVAKPAAPRSQLPVVEVAQVEAKPAARRVKPRAKAAAAKAGAARLKRAAAARQAVIREVLDANRDAIANALPVVAVDDASASSVFSDDASAASYVPLDNRDVGGAWNPNPDLGRASGAPGSPIAYDGPGWNPVGQDPVQFLDNYPRRNLGPPVPARGGIGLAPAVPIRADLVGPPPAVPNRDDLEPVENAYANSEAPGEALRRVMAARRATVEDSSDGGMDEGVGMAAMGAPQYNWDE
jgi:hypothetical protein